MMLPEHVAMLRELKVSETKKSKPLIDEQQLQEMNKTVHLAIETKSIVAVTYFHKYECREIVGVIKTFDLTSRCIRIVSYENTFTINLGNIIDIKIEYE